MAAAVIEAGYATLHELDTIYGLESMWNMYEVYVVARHNEYLAVKNADRH